MIGTHGYVMANGRHKGELITRVPVSYLKWMVNERHSAAEYAQAELDRRGTTTPELDVSGHALDSASLRLLRLWQARKNADQGLHSWLVALAQDALAKGEKRVDKIAYGGVLFAFAQDGGWPVLKTVMRDKGQPDPEDVNWARERVAQVSSVAPSAWAGTPTGEGNPPWEV